MRTASQRLRIFLVAAIGVALTGVVMLLAVTDALRQLELDTVDARFEIRADRPPPDDVVAVLIDARTFQRLNVQWPFPRSLHGKVIDEVARAGAKAIAYDVQFTEPTRATEDAALMDAVGRARGRVVLATTEVNERGESGVFGDERTVRSLGARSGNALFNPDPDAVIRKMPFAVDGLTGFAVAAVEVAKGRRISRAEFGSGSAWIDYHGASGSIPSYSFADVYEHKVDARAFRDKIVVVGTDAPSLQDDNPTSVGGDAPMSGAEIHANAISTLLRGTPLEDLPRGADLLLVALLGMAGPLFAISRRRQRLPLPVGILAVAIVIGAAYAVAAQAMFQAGLILPVVYPLTALCLATLGVLQVELTSAVLDRDHARKQFARFVPPSVVDDVLRATNDEGRLGGERVQCTVVFVDVRESTSFLELRPAEQGIDALNVFLAEMSAAIRARGGTVVRFEGDGIMAAFGAPIEQLDHADRAIEAVREMVGPRLDRVNAWLRAHAMGPGFRIGVGVASGIVMSGTIGDELRLEYAVIGDTANTARRLEEKTKELAHQVLIAENTRAMLRRDTPGMQYLDAVEISGKRVKVNLWTLAEVSPRNPDEQRAVETVEQG